MEQAASARRWALPSMGDVWGGLAGMLVALPSAIAFGVLVFSAIDPALAGSVALTTVTDSIGFFAFLGLAQVFYL